MRAATGGSAQGALRAPLHEALGEQLRELDKKITHTWRILGIVGVVGGLLVWKVLGFEEGPSIAALSGFGVAWFTVYLFWLERPSARWAERAEIFVETILPTCFLLAITFTRAAADALGSYVPPMLYAAVMVAGIARLWALAPLLYGAANAALFLGSYFFVIQDRLTPEEAIRPLFSTGMQITRALAFAFGGVLAFLVTREVRRAFGRAERNVRSLDLFGKYRLGDQIGAGGMGVVHDAVYCPEGGFERRVAMKLLHSHLAGEPSFIEAFRQEAELSARLVHPNIVQVLDFGRVGERYFLAMEHVQGTTLGGLAGALRRANRTLDPELVAWIGGEILEGLEHSHADARDGDGQVLHVVHRDLCPPNVLVSVSGEVKVSDFGVAKALRDAASDATKTVVGHVGYMAPEQMRAESIDERCDLFAAGVIMWELLTGRSLFRRGNEALTIMAVLDHEVPRVSTVRDDTTPEWDGFFARALAPSPSQRFVSAAQMRVALAALRRTNDAKQSDLAPLVHWAMSLPKVSSGPPANRVEQTSATEIIRSGA